MTAEALAAADGDPFLGAVIAGRYAILGRLGAGSMGTVYRARSEADGRDVAVKIVRTDRLHQTHAKPRFMREVRAMSMLRSPHTVTVYDFGEVTGEVTERARGDEEFEGSAPVFYLAMELLKGEPLGERLARRARLSVEESLGVARHALLSLAEAHEKGVIHRDLKPDNLFLTVPEAPGQEEICKILDFGIAKIAGEKTGGVDAADTQEGVVFGTPRYMSPEQAQGKSVDARSDLYTLGVLLYQMLVGEPPFAEDEAVVVMAHHIKTPPVPPALAAPNAGIPAHVSDLVLRALSKDPNLRPQSAREFIEEVDKAMQLCQSRPDITSVGTLEVPARLLLEMAEASGGTSSKERGSAPKARAFQFARALVATLAVACGVSFGAVMFELLRPRNAPEVQPAGDALLGVAAELATALSKMPEPPRREETEELGADASSNFDAGILDAGAAGEDAGESDAASAPIPGEAGSAQEPPAPTVRPPPFRIHRRFNQDR